MIIFRVALALQVVLAQFDQGAAQLRRLQAVWDYATPQAFPQSIVCDQMRRPYLYVAMKNGGLVVLDHSNPNAAPTEVAVMGTAQLDNLEVMNLAQQRDRLYLALGDFFNAKGSATGIAVVGVENPRAPKLLSMWKSADRMQGAAAVLIQGRHAYLGAMTHGIMIFDVSNPKRMKKIATILPDVNYPRKNPNRVQHPNARGFAIKDHHLYVAFDAGGLRVIDVANPAKPVEISRYSNVSMAKKQQAYNNLVIDGTAAYVAVDYAGLEILDIRNPREIKQIAWWNPWKAHTLENLWFNSPGHTNQIEFDAQQRRVFLSAGDSDLLVVDVSDRAHPKMVASHGAPKDKLGVWGLTISDEYVYLAFIKAIIPFHSTWSGIKALKR